MQAQCNFSKTGLLVKCVRKYICWILHAPVDVHSVFGLTMHPVRVLIVRYMFVCCPSLIQRHFACWTEAVRCIFVTCTFQPFHVQCMYVRSFGFSTGLTFLPPDNKNSYPFHVRRFNPVKCDRGLTIVCRMEISNMNCLTHNFSLCSIISK